jgi:hypothetical protein
MSWFDSLLDDFTAGLKTAGQQGLDYIMSPEGILQLGSAGLSYLGNASGIGDPQIPPTGYQGGIPQLTAIRRGVPMQQPGTPEADADMFSGLGSLQGAAEAQRPRLPEYTYDPNRRPGSSGRRYFTDVEYVQGAAGETAARTRGDEQARALMEYNLANPAREERRPPPQPPETVEAAAGGLMGLKKGKYLNGSTDGMADKVPAEIDGRQPAALSDGEFVIPADVVSHLGNGNSAAGAKILKQMMARVRKERTGNEKQGKEIKPNKMLPA